LEKDEGKSERRGGGGWRNQTDRALRKKKRREELQPLFKKGDRGGESWTKEKGKKEKIKDGKLTR